MNRGASLLVSTLSALLFLPSPRPDRADSCRGAPEGARPSLQLSPGCGPQECACPPLSTFVHRGAEGQAPRGSTPPPKRSLPASFPGGRPRNVAAEILRNALPAPAGHDVRFHFLFHLTLLPTIPGAAQYTLGSWAVESIGEMRGPKAQGAGCETSGMPGQLDPPYTPTPLPIPQCRCRCSSRTPTDLGAG